MMKKENKQIFLLIGVIAIIGIVAFLIRGIFAPEVKMEIEGEEVTSAEYYRSMEYRTGKVLEFYEGIEPGSVGQQGFWTKEIAGKRPVERLAEDTKDEVLKNRAKYLLAVENGDIDTVSFYEVEKRWEEENERRQKAIEDGEPILGVSNFDFDEYVFYEQQYFMSSYIKNHAEELFNVSDEEVNAYYENTKNNEFEEIKTELDFVRIPADHVTPEIEADLESLAERLRSGEKMRDISSEYPSISRYVQRAELSPAERELFSDNLSDVFEAFEDITSENRVVIKETANTLVLVQDSTLRGSEGLTHKVREEILFELRSQMYNKLVEDRAKELEFTEDRDSNIRFITSVVE